MRPDCLRLATATTFLFALALAGGCGDDGGGTDTGTTDGSTFTPIDPTTACEYSPGPYGVEQGAVMAPFALPQCDGTPYQLVGNNFCAPTHRYTVVNLAAEWCAPCRVETMELEAGITSIYGPQGVSVVQVLVEDRNFSPAQQSTCQGWQRVYPQNTNVLVSDAGEQMDDYWPMGTLPTTMIIDETGTIVFKETGAAEGITSLATKLDELLAQ